VNAPAGAALAAARFLAGNGKRLGFTKRKTVYKLFNHRRHGISRLLLGGPSSIFNRFLEDEPQADERKCVCQRAKHCSRTHASAPPNQNAG